MQRWPVLEHWLEQYSQTKKSGGVQELAMANMIILMKDFNDVDLELSIRSWETILLIAKTDNPDEWLKCQSQKDIRFVLPILKPQGYWRRAASSCFWIRNEYDFWTINVNNGFCTPLGCEELTLTHLRSTEPHEGQIYWWLMWSA